MKNILSYSFIFIFFLLSCRKEELQRIPTFTKGINFLAKVDPTNSALNVNDLTNAKLILNVTSANAEEIAKVDLIGVYIRQLGEKPAKGDTLVGPVLIKSLTGAELNSTVTITAAQFATALGKQITDFLGADIIYLRYVATMKNGAVFSDANSTEAILSSGGTTFTSSLTVPVYCPTALKGTYTTLTTGTSTDPAPNPNPTVNFPSEITLTVEGLTSYRISDSFGGLYREWYGVYGIKDPLPTIVVDVCGKLSASFLGPFDGKITGTGTYDANGVITMEWSNAFDDKATTVYTPKK